MEKILAVIVASVFLLSLVAGGYSHGEEKDNHPADRLMKVKDRIKDRVSDATKLEGLREHQLKVLEGVDAKFKDRVNGLAKEKLQRLAHMPPGVARRMVENSDLETKLGMWMVKNFSKAEMAKAFVKRVVAVDKLKSAEERVKKARENLDLAKKQFKDKRDEFKRTKNVTDAKDYLLKVLDALVEKVNNLKERVGGSDDLSEEKAKEVLADLDARLTKLNDWKTKVQAAATKEELKKLVVEVRAGWKHIDHALKVHGWRVALEHFGGILRQAEHLDNKLNRLLDLADKNNVTINNKDSRVADFEAKLADSRKHFELAVGDFKKLRDLVGNKTENITDSEVAERKALVESSHNHLKVAKKSLKDARQVLVSLAKDTVKELKAKGAKTDDGKAVDIKEEDVLDPTKVIDGVDIEEGETAVPVAQEETIEL